MAVQLYYPFKTKEFKSDQCFLTGQPVSSEEQIFVFPEWLMHRYDLREKTFTMLGDGNVTKYKDLKMPCTFAVQQKSIDVLEGEIKNAFSIGYKAVVNIPKERLFQWMAKLVYGVLYNDFKVAIEKQSERNDSFSLSPFLENRFKNLHLMLQSLIHPIEYRKGSPWSIEVVRVKYSKDIFNYKDETNNLNFSLGMHDFGIVACLQDNGENSKFHQELIAKIGDKTLHPIQFEELCSRFIYSNYLLNQYPEYSVLVKEDKVFVEPVIFSSQSNKPLFNVWEDEMFGQVLANYWKPWGITMSDIITFPNAPISFMVNDYSNELIAPESISLPY